MSREALVVSEGRKLPVLVQLYSPFGTHSCHGPEEVVAYLSHLHSPPYEKWQMGSALVKLAITVIKHHEQKQVGEERLHF